MKRASNFRIHGTARHDWEYFDTPHSIEDVVDGLFQLPSGQLTEVSPRSDWHMVHGRVFGKLFMMAGFKNDIGEWVEARVVSPVWPPR